MAAICSFFLIFTPYFTNRITNSIKMIYKALSSLLAGTVLASAAFYAPTAHAEEIVSARRLNPTTVELNLANGKQLTVDFYGENIFRLFRDDNGGIMRHPAANPPASILVKNPRKAVGAISLSETPSEVTVSSPRVSLTWSKGTGLLTVRDLKSGREVMKEAAPVSFEKGKTRLTLNEQPGEYFYGGGVQNGRFSHKGKQIAIVNSNSWTDNGVASPAPFYWSTAGYGLMPYTFAPGKYDFGKETPGKVAVSHDTDYLDAFVMVDETPAELLSDFYQLTGNPVLLPKFGFYEGHLNAYNRDFWKEDPKGILFEDGKTYKESQRDNGGIKESLNGEKNNYQFSARGVIDRYAAHDMPLGWILPNDGYGAGYGQTTTLDGNIANLKSFGDYARSKGVEIGLWTQSDLHPKAGIDALLQRDIVKEVRDAGVRVLKTDVAWVGDGYSFGLNGVSDVGEIMPYYGNDARPFIISLDGWTGTQRYAGVWSGDQTGGEWEYIRFHIPTYIGSGLSGQPNITSDMDGIFGGKNAAVNIRDFEWKTFTPMQLNMDGWGYNPKYPQALGEPATSINRNYLKLKSELLPYAYTYAREAVTGKPLIRAMMLDYPNHYTLGTATRYQYLYGPDLLVAPIYQNTKADEQGNDIRHGIYLPEGIWLDYFNGDAYEGNRVLNFFEAPIWKLPVFVKAGAIIPMVNPNNNPSQIDKHLRIYEFYPYGSSEMTEYDDDGTTQQYLAGIGATTRVASDVKGSNLSITIDPTKGTFDGFEPMKATRLLINASERPKSVTATVGGKRVNLTKSADGTQPGTFAYVQAPELNRFSTPGSPAASVKVSKNPQIVITLPQTNISDNAVRVDVKGFALNSTMKQGSTHGSLQAPSAAIAADAIEPYALTPSWNPVANADFYEVMFDSVLYTNIRDNKFTFADLTPETAYSFDVRAVNADGNSAWSNVKATTADNPLEWAIRGIRGEVNVPIQEGFEVSRLFDFAESGDRFHTKYGAKALPFELTADLQSVNTLDKMKYLPRPDAGNGTILRALVSVSLDKQHWTPVDSIVWERNGEAKEFIFAKKPEARYVKLSVSDAVNNYGSGQELYIFKVPGTESHIPGDINNDGKVDNNDLTSYMNYTGLRKGDSDFEGYISGGDINRNGLIDAFDISVVATRLEDGVEPDDYAKALAGNVVFDIPVKVVAAGDTLSILVKGKDLSSVNAISVAIPYDATLWEFAGIDPLAVKGMENLTYDRLHTNGVKELFPTFVNVGEKLAINGNADLFVIKMKARRRAAFKATPKDGMLVDKKLNTLAF